MFDTADVYSNGAAEEILGKAINGRRKRVLISTKAGLPVRGRNRTMWVLPASIFCKPSKEACSACNRLHRLYSKCTPSTP